MAIKSVSAITFLVATVYGQVATWGQCGGVGYAGSTVCTGGTFCSTLNAYYAQCLPGAATTTAVATTTRSTTPVITTTTRSSTIRTTTTSSKTSSTTRQVTTSTPTSGGPGPGSTLISPYIWIRAVEAPYFHKYLQSLTLRTTGEAVMGDYTTAGQFDIVNGQLVQLINTSGALLYGHIEQQTSSSQTKLQLTWATTPDTYGTFAWSGDAVTWTASGVTRQNNAAWLICGSNADAYVNLGAYAYMTPAGCSDATIHFYNGATAVN
ncbi:hypothetical protein AA313_de0201338 [Arthrobotrys entomopaga]|nr:hypothetical protein AA313_de0201338 [Arthrobotrys entomopaga]